jgi:hypothetical protein
MSRKSWTTSDSNISSRFIQNKTSYWPLRTQRGGEDEQKTWLDLLPPESAPVERVSAEVGVSASTLER